MLQEVTQFWLLLTFLAYLKISSLTAVQPKIKNKLLATDISALSPTNTVWSFKCAVHPLLQFSEVCEKEISKLESDFKVNI